MDPYKAIIFVVVAIAALIAVLTVAAVSQQQEATIAPIFSPMLPLVY